MGGLINSLKSSKQQSISYDLTYNLTYKNIFCFKKVNQSSIPHTISTSYVFLYYGGGCRQEDIIKLKND